MKILYLLLLMPVLIYLFLALMWYYYPTKLVDLNYKIIGKEKMENFDNEPKIFVIDHENTTSSDLADISIISNEIWKHPNKFVFLMSPGVLWARYNLYFSKNERLIKTKDTVKKIISILKNRKNVVIFLKKEHKGKGIYNILKNINVDLVLMKKKLIKQRKRNKIYSILFKGWEHYVNAAADYSIEYVNIGKNYNLDKKPENFMQDLKNQLFF